MQDTSNLSHDKGPVETSSQSKTRQACEPCKLRKRRCDGNSPCATCQRYQYECYYTAPRKRRSKKVASTESATTLDTSEMIRAPNSRRASFSTSTPRSDKTDALSPEINSGILFPQLVGTSLGPENLPKLQGLGWNLGHHYFPSSSDKNITWIVSKDEWLSLFAIYIQKIHSVYSFLDLALIRSKIAKRWNEASATNSYDHVLCGIAALACLFTPGPIDEREQLFVDYAKELLQSTGYERQPGPHEVQASVLRLLYVRANCPPHAAWMASGATMQIIEASGLHKEDVGSSVRSEHHLHESIDTECRRKTFWIAKLLNTWISNEYGRTQSAIVGTSCQLPVASPGDPITEFLAMLQTSVILEPNKSPSVGDLEIALRRVEQYVFGTDCLVLSKANLCFTFYRRLRLLTGSIKQELLNKIISIGLEGLQASLRAIEAWTPWWHVSNVPFQFTCILLAMDTPEALAHVSQAVTALRLAADTFRSPVVQTALETIEHLVALSHKRKQQGMTSLAGVVPNQNTERAENQLYIQSLSTLPAAPANAWLSDLLWSSPNLDEVNWNQFWDDAFPINSQ